MDEKILERARKLKRMMDGNGATENEIEQAHSMLMRLLEKHGLTLDALDETKRTYRKFSYSNRWEKSLLIQILGMVLDKTTFHTGKAKGKAVLIELTDAENTDVASLYKVYRKELMLEFDAVTSAFFYKHDIFPATPSNKPTQQAPMDESFIEKLKLYYKALRSLPDPRHKQLSSGERVA